MTVVVNSTPLIYLAAIGKFDLLRIVYGRIIFPPAVFHEVVTQGAGRYSTEVPVPCCGRLDTRNQ